MRRLFLSSSVSAILQMKYFVSGVSLALAIGLLSVPQSAQAASCPAAYSEVARPSVRGQSDDTYGYVIRDGQAVWNIKTGRGYADYIKSLDEINDSQKGRRFWPLPKFNVEDVLSGRRNLLSLGEGEGGFVSTLINERAKRGVDLAAIENIHAVDVAYNSANSDSRFYHGSLLQKIDIRDRAGRKILFDEIVSSWSLNFVLSRQSAAQQAEMLGAILQNLKPGGTLRFWPGVKESEPGEIARILEEKGLIKNWWFGEQTVLQRK